MRLLAIRLARTIWLVPPYFANPRGIFTRPIVEALKTRYSFLKTPLDAGATFNPNDGYKYENGAFQTEHGPIMIMSMTIHNDGIVVDTRSSTADGDAFLQDMATFTHKNFGLESPDSLLIKRIYSSELNVMLDRTPTLFNPALKNFMNALSTEVRETDQGDATFLGFQLTTTGDGQVKRPVFRFERELNTPIEQNRYYTHAPIETEAHIRLVETLEQLAT